MVASSNTTGATILIGISLDEDDSRDLLSWAINILSHPSDTVVAVHVLAGEEPKKLAPKTRDHKRYQRSKAYAVQVMAEFSKLCESRQVHLQARVRYSSSVGKGLIKEAKESSAEFLVLGGSDTSSKGTVPHGVTKYCFKHAPKGCSIMSIGKPAWSKSDLKSVSSLLDGSPVSEQSDGSKGNAMESSPGTVLTNEGESPRTDDGDDSSSFSELCSSSSPAHAILQNQKRTPLKRIVSSLFRLPFEVIARKKTDDSTISSRENNHNQPPMRCFSYEEISRATNDFHSENMVGRGGYSEVYRGNIVDGNSIAVKRLAKDNTNAKKEKEFLIELGIIGHVTHPNTASITGYCIENGLYFVFGYSPNGNLCNALHGTYVLEWPVRYKIALGIARGLHYLHKCCKHKIIHRDIKASNVLLGLDYEPQITDFGLAKWLPSKGLNHAVAPIIEGTFGYLAPEYFMHGMVDEKTDVYAFGVLLLEIITGRRPVDHLTKQNLFLWATPLIESGKIEELFDPRLQGAYEVGQVHRLVLAASNCVQQSSSHRPSMTSHRPSMTEVLELLEESRGTDQMGRSWRVPKVSTDEVNDHSMVFGYNFPIDFNLDEVDEW